MTKHILNYKIVKNRYTDCSRPEFLTTQLLKGGGIYYFGDW